MKRQHDVHMITRVADRERLRALIKRESPNAIMKGDVAIAMQQRPPITDGEDDMSQ